MKALIQTGSSLSACGHAQAGGRVSVPLKSDFLSILILPLAFAAALLVPLSTIAYECFDFTYNSDGTAITVSRYTGGGGNVTIPEMIEGLPVVRIGRYAFYPSTTITNVFLPDSVTTIESGAFMGCTGLAHITIPDSVTSIEDSAFAFCSGLEAFSIPEGITRIRGSTFSNCIALTRVDIPHSVTSIDPSAFYNCTNLVRIAIPDSVTSIGADAFAHCTSLASVVIPGSVVLIENHVFGACTSLTNIMVDPNNSYFCSVDGVLFDKTKATLIQYPGGKVGCYSVPDSVTCIQMDAFERSAGLTSVIIPQSVTNIGFFAFYKCSSLLRTYFLGAPPTGPQFIFSDSPATLYYLPAFAPYWPSTYGDRPTKLWNPAFTSTALAAGAVSCTVTGSPPIPIAMEATTNLTTGPWVRLCTTNLTNNSLDLHDPDSSSHPARFYRIIGP